MAGNNLLETLKDQNVTIYTPDTFDVNSYLQDLVQNDDMQPHFLVAADGTGTDMYIKVEYNESTFLPFAEVSVEDGQKTLLSQDEYGNQIGRVSDVEQYIKDNFSEGFFDKDEATAKIEDYDKLFNDQFPYEEYLSDDVEREDDGFAGRPEFEEDPSVVSINDLDLDGLSLDEQGKLIADMLIDSGELQDSVSAYLGGIENAEIESSNKMDLILETQTDWAPDAKNEAFFGGLSTKEQEVIKSGFIPFELREGYPGEDSENRLTTDMVKDIREHVDPEFGMVCGIDTTKYNIEKGPDKNVSTFKISYDDIKQYVNDTSIKETDIKSINVTKEYGEKEMIQGIPFRVTNLVTFEIELKDDHKLYSSLIIDDTGTVRGDLYSLAAGNYEDAFRFSLDDNTSDGHQIERMHFDKLDRTDTHTLGHFRQFEKNDPEFRESFLKDVNDSIDGCLERIVSTYENNLDPQSAEEPGRRAYMDYNMDQLEAKVSSLHNITNVIELYKENLQATALEAESKETVILNQLESKLDERSKMPIDSDAYKEKNIEIQDLKVDYAKNHQILVNSKADFERVTRESSPITNAYFDLKDQLKSLGNEYEKLFNGVSVDGTGRDIDKDQMSSPDRFKRICNNISQRRDMLPTHQYVSVDRILSNPSVQDVIEESFDKIESIVDEYNQGTTIDTEKILIANDKDPDSASLDGIYTYSGYEIRAVSIPYDHNIEEVYDSSVDREHSGDNRVDSWANDKATGSDKTREEIYQSFIEKGIDLGFSRGSLMDRVPSSSTIMDKIDDDKEVRELTAIRDIVEKNPDGNFDSLEKYKDEIEDRIENPEKVVETEEKVEVIEQRDNYNDATLEKKIGRISHGAYGKTDDSKGVEISSKKMEELKKDADIEAKKNGKESDEILKEKIEAQKEKLEIVRNDIIHFKSKMDDFEKIPARYRSMHCGYQAAKVEYDSAIRSYGLLGGKVGDDCFVTKGVNKQDLRFSKSEFLRTSYGSSIAIDLMYGDKTRDILKSLTIDEDGKNVRSYSGGLVEKLQRRSTLGEIINRPFASVVVKILKLNDIDLDKLDKILEKNEDRLESKIEREESPKDSVSNPDIDSPDQENRDTLDQKDADNVELQIDQHENDDSVIQNDEDTKQNQMDKESDIDKTDQEKVSVSDEESSERMDISEEEDDKKEQLIDNEKNKDESDKPEIEPSDSSDVEQNEKDESKLEVDQAEDIEADPEDEISDVEKDESDKEISLEDEKEKGDVEKEENLIDKDIQEESDIEVKSEEDQDNPDKEDLDQKNDVDSPESEDDDKVETEENDVDKSEIEKDVDDLVDNDTEDPDMISEDDLEMDMDLDQTDSEISEKESLDTQESLENQIENPELENMTDEYLKDTTDEIENPEVEDVSKEDSEQMLNEIETKTDGMASDNEMLTHQDVTSIDQTDNDPEEPELPQNGEIEQGIDEKNPDSEKEYCSEVSNRIEQAVNGNEELNDIFSDIGDKIVDGFDPVSLLDAMIDGLNSAIQSGSSMEEIGDVVFEAMNFFNDSPIETMDYINDNLIDQGVPQETIEAIEEHVADNFEEYDGPFEDTAYGEFYDFEFTSDDIFDAATGSEDIDLADFSYDMDSFMEDAMSLADFNVPELDAVEVSNDIENDLESQGIEIDDLPDLSIDLFENIYNDASNGIDISSDDYMDNMTNTALENIEFITDDQTGMDDVMQLQDFENPSQNMDFESTDPQQMADFDSMQQMQELAESAIETAEAVEAAVVVAE